MKITYIGNFQPAHSTENDILWALRQNGHTVKPLQESDFGTWKYLRDDLLNDRPDFLLWTRTWHLPEFQQHKIIERLKAEGVLVVGYHLDRWWGLGRETEIDEHAFFLSDVLCTADGGHNAEWESKGIKHWWYPPATNRRHIQELGDINMRYAWPIGFVGTWKEYGHTAWDYRNELIRQLKGRFDGRFHCWPEQRNGEWQPRVVGKDLNDLYQSVDVIVGDSCLAGNATHYCSDRIPETLGRGGFLIHPYVKGVTDGSLYEPGSHLATYRLGHYDELFDAIERWLGEPKLRNEIAESGRRHVLMNHTYENRMQQLIKQLQEEKLLDDE